MKFFHPLMSDNISKSDRNIASKLILNKKILTNSEKVEEFEKKWSKWLGVKYSIFVNSGSSANLLTMHALKIIGKNNKKNEILVPALTWSSDIVSVLNANFKPIFVDIDPTNLSMSVEDIKKKISNRTRAIFLTHAQGFSGLSKNLIKIIKKKKIIFIEDVCESHGATFEKKKLGTFGLISNFSFYYAHHMSTIEGGMICTNNKEIYEICRVLRSHGMAREINNQKLFKKICKKFPKLNPKFIFLYPGFNVRSNEISAAIGINQLKKLDENIKKRNYNLTLFLKLLRHDIYFKNFNLKGISNYALPIILKNKNIKLRNKLEKTLSTNKIEFRRGNAGGGNQLRQPYLSKYSKKQRPHYMKNTDHIHFFGYYIGNYPTLKKEKIEKLCEILNSI